MKKFGVSFFLVTIFLASTVVVSTQSCAPSVYRVKSTAKRGKIKSRNSTRGGKRIQSSGKMGSTKRKR